MATPGYINTQSTKTFHAEGAEEAGNEEGTRGTFRKFEARLG